MSAPSETRVLVSLTLSFRPLAEQIASLRATVSDLCRPHLSGADELSRVLLATHELLENIVKYSSDGAAEFHCHLESGPHGVSVRLRTKNRALPERLDDTLQRLAALEAASDPVTHYDDLIRAAAGRRDGSGLGLARIPAESDMVLRCATDQDWLVLTAESSPNSRGNT
jgi:hypothetical protein